MLKQIVRHAATLSSTLGCSHDNAAKLQLMEAISSAERTALQLAHRESQMSITVWILSTAGVTIAKRLRTVSRSLVMITGCHTEGQ